MLQSERSGGLSGDRGATWPATQHHRQRRVVAIWAAVAAICVGMSVVVPAVSASASESAALRAAEPVTVATRTTGDRGPRLQTSRTELARTLHCTDDLAGARKTPVLLVHGTGATPADDFSWNYLQYLPQRGYPTCTVTIPSRALGDVQSNVEYVVHALRTIHRQSGRKVSVIGHSQGAFLATYALRFWPDLAHKVDDLIGFAGTYTYGTDVANVICSNPITCVTAFTQFKPGSRFLAAVAARPLPKGPSYTAFSTALDEIVIPQPHASTLHAPGARNYRLQSICPLDVAEHLLIIGERPMQQLTFDALDHRGPARLSRVANVRCGLLPETAQAVLPSVNFLLGIVGELPAVRRPSMREPELRCYLTDSCR